MKWTKYFPSDSSFEISTWVFDQFNIWDSHVHLGKDMDGSSLNKKEILKLMSLCNIEKSIIIPFNDSRKQNNYEISNNQIFNAYKEHKNRFIPFFRINPKKEFVKEFDKRAEQGFCGVKLHPRSENFSLDDREAMKIYSLAEKHDIVVLIHAGLGMIDISNKIEKISNEYRNLKIILGHSAFTDMLESIKKLPKLKNVYFDTSSLKIFDLYDLIKNVSNKKILFGSDMPYFRCDYSLEAIIQVFSLLDKKMSDVENILSGNLSEMFS